MPWLTDLTARCHAQLLSEAGQQARAYLAGRGVTPEEIQLYQIGLAVPPAPGEGTPAFLRWARVFWAGRLVFPLTSVLGDVIGYQTRSLGKKDYAQFYSTPTHVHPYAFGIHQALPEIWRTHQCVICEGVFDALALRKAAPNTIAVLSALFPATITRFLLRYTVRVVAVLDMDGPGRAGVHRLQVWYPELRAVGPEYPAHDPADLLVQGRYQDLVRVTAPAREVLPW